ncbi:MAG: DNA alkylation repair protein [Chloroflexi bacterium]|nr:DNA alkylation repair protein [Chloroflexota bacterium]
MTTAGAVWSRPASPVTARAIEFVASRRAAAEGLGTDLAELVNDPEAFVEALRAGFVSLADREYQVGQHAVAPGLGSTYGVRNPLLTTMSRAFRAATRQDRPTTLLYLADRLFREEHLEARWFAFLLLGRTLPSDPERTWQLLRRAAREAADWITVDSLAHPYGRGILAEPYRWAELEQLVFSPSPWERRLVASTIATAPFEDRSRGKTPGYVETSLPILGQLMGDAEPDVQKALAWAYRTVAGIDRAATTAALTAEVDLAVAEDDGHRAWVVRNSLTKLDRPAADRLRALVRGIRRRAGSPSTSPAALAAARFAGLPDPRRHPEPPLG